MTATATAGAMDADPARHTIGIAPRQRSGTDARGACAAGSVSVDGGVIDGVARRPRARQLDSFVRRRRRLVSDASKVTCVRARRRQRRACWYAAG
jgi:hypothetical protein